MEKKKPDNTRQASQLNYLKIRQDLVSWMTLQANHMGNLLPYEDRLRPSCLVESLLNTTLANPPQAAGLAGKSFTQNCGSCGNLVPSSALQCPLCHAPLRRESESVR